MAPVDPVLVEVTRGDTNESRHRGAFAVVDAEGAVVLAGGDVESPRFARSAAKPLQALPLLESGAADAFSLSPAEIALACASHSGEPEHVGVIAAWLARIGLDKADLECGARPPLGEAAAEAARAAGRPPSPLADNCSGKHLGFLTTAVYLGEPTAGYVGADHPVQRRVARVLAGMGGFDLAAAPTAVDGCRIPVIGMGLTALARAMARLAAPAGLAPERARAARRIVAAMAAHPRLVAGEGRFDTAAIAAAGGAFVTKNGAEGVHVAIIPRLGLGAALKIDDGAKRAADCAMAALLDRLGLLDGPAREALARFAAAPIPDAADGQVGVVRPAGPLAIG